MPGLRLLEYEYKACKIAFKGFNTWCFIGVTFRCLHIVGYGTPFYILLDTVHLHKKKNYTVFSVQDIVFYNHAKFIKYIFSSHRIFFITGAEVFSAECLTTPIFSSVTCQALPEMTYVPIMATRATMPRKSLMYIRYATFSLPIPSSQHKFKPTSVLNASNFQTVDHKFVPGWDTYI